MESDYDVGRTEPAGPISTQGNDSPQRSSGRTSQLDSKQAKVLIASNDLLTLQIYQSILDSQGFKVLTCRGRLDTLGESIRFRPDVTVLDSCLLKSKGLEVASELLSMRPSSKVVFIMRDEPVSKDAETLGIEIFLKWSDSLHLILGSVRALSNLKYTCIIVPR